MIWVIKKNKHSDEVVGKKLNLIWEGCLGSKRKLVFQLGTGKGKGMAYQKVVYRIIKFLPSSCNICPYTNKEMMARVKFWWQWKKWQPCCRLEEGQVFVAGGLCRGSDALCRSPVSKIASLSPSLANVCLKVSLHFSAPLNLRLMISLTL